MKSSKCRLLCLTSSALYFLAIFCLQVEEAQAQQTEDLTQNGSKSKIFIIGATGRFGRYVVDASVNAKQPTVALVRPSALNDPVKAELVSKFISDGVEIVYGDFKLNETIVVNAMKRVDVVISCVAGTQVIDQAYIIEAIKKAGCIKRFFPSEYAIDVDHIHNPVDPAKLLFAGKFHIRRAVEKAGIPHTFVIANGFAGRIWPNLAQLVGLLPNITEVIAYGDGNSKVIATMEEDVAAYVIKTVDDPRTLNKNLYLKPKANTLSYNDLFALWEKKSGTILKKTYIPGEELLQMIKDAPFGLNTLLALCYSEAIKNEYDSYVIEPSFGFEATELYPEYKYTTVNEYYDGYFTKLNSFSGLSTETQGKASL